MGTYVCVYITPRGFAKPILYRGFIKAPLYKDFVKLPF